MQPPPSVENPIQIPLPLGAAPLLEGPCQIAWLWRDRLEYVPVDLPPMPGGDSISLDKTTHEGRECTPVRSRALIIKHFTPKRDRPTYTVIVYTLIVDDFDQTPPGLPDNVFATAIHSLSKIFHGRDLAETSPQNIILMCSSAVEFDDESLLSVYEQGVQAGTYHGFTYGESDNGKAFRYSRFGELEIDENARDKGQPMEFFSSNSNWIANCDIINVIGGGTTQGNS